MKFHLDRISYCLWIFFYLLSFSSIFSDSFRNINGFFGERATGMGGAFTAISDDPSGGYYNPAGLAYAYDYSISLSVSNYNSGKKTYEDVLGPGQGYGREFKSYIPNFFGVVRELDSGGKVSFSILNPVNETFQRNDQIQLPLYYPEIANIRVNNRESFNTILIGVSYADFLISGKLSWGLSAFYLQDTKSFSISSITQLQDGSFNSQSISDNKTTTGVVPTLGLMFTPTDILSFGFSFRRTVVVTENRLINSFIINSQGSSQNILFFEGTHNANGGSAGDRVTKLPTPTGKVPELNEIRLGFAVFPSREFLTSFDIIYTGGYSFRKDNTEYIIGGDSPSILIFTDREDFELQRSPTTNFALGTEYFLTEFFSIRLGTFTNYANTKRKSWIESVASNLFLEESGDISVIYADSSTILAYRWPFLRENPRNEYLNTFGYSIGFSFSTAATSFGINIIKEFGRGSAEIDSGRPIQPLNYNATYFYVAITSKVN